MTLSQSLVAPIGRPAIAAPEHLFEIALRRATTSQTLAVQSDAGAVRLLPPEPVSAVAAAYSRRIQDLVRRRASAEAAVRCQRGSSFNVTRCQRAQPGQRTF